MGVSDFRGLYNDLQNTKTDIGNRFGNYSPNHSYGDMTGTIDSLFNAQTGVMNRNAANSIQRGTRDATSRLASQGITGGSVMNNQLNKISDNINSSNADALTQLGIGRMQQQTGLMNQDNANQFNITNAAQGVDAGNRQALLQRLGLQSGVLGQQEAAEQYDEQKPGFLDDLFAGMNAVGSLGKAAFGGANGAGFLR